MAITDAGVPGTDAWQTLKDVIVANMESPDGVWTPSVNDGWLEMKKQKIQYEPTRIKFYGNTQVLFWENEK